MTGEPSRRWVIRVGAVLAVVAASGFAAFWFWPRPAGPGPTRPGDDADDLLVVHNPGYVGPDACAECHAARVAEFRKTNHYHACRRPDDGPMPPGFAPGRGTLLTARPDLHFEMTHVGDGYFQETVRTGPDGEQRSVARIGLVYGVGGLDEVNFTWRGDQLVELPVAWLHPLGKWGHVPVNLNRPGDLGRGNTFRCQECHNTWFAHVPGSADRYRPDSFILGVTCERCHGPGRDHVVFHKEHPGARATAIVNPDELTRDRRTEVCTQCHGNVINRRSPPFSYRPGEPLADHFRTLAARHREDDHVANQVKYMEQSACYQHSEELTCVTCHNPHRPADHSAVQQSCLKCHEPTACRERPRVPAGVRDNCSGCHMPPRVWINVHFHTADDQFVPPIRRSDHRIAVHPEARDSVLLEWYRGQSDPDSKREADRLARRLTDYWLAESEARQKNYRFLASMAAAREALRVDPTPAVRRRLADAIAARSRVLDLMIEGEAQSAAGRHADAIDTFTKVLQLKPDYADAHAQLGKVYAATNRPDLAVREWREESRCDPDSSYGYTMIGWLALLDNRFDEALEMYRKADEVTPYNSEIAFRTGWALEGLGRLPQATEAFRKATLIDPTHVAGYERLSGALRRQGYPEEAISAARRAVKLTRSENAEALMTLAEACAAAGRREESDEVGAKALAVARAEELAGIRARLEAMRSGSRP